MIILKKRIISAGIMLLIVIPLIILGGIPFAFAVGIIGMLAYKELININGEKEYPEIVKIFGLIGLILLIFCNFNKFDFSIPYKLICGIIIILSLPIMLNKKKYDVEDFFHILSIVLFLGIGFNLVIMIYNYDIKRFIMLILITILTDTFAYFGGRLIGKHKFTKISPNKTIEGCIVGSLVSTIVCTIYYLNIISFGNNIFRTVFLILLLSVIGQIGDLFFSAIKRKYNKKDFSNLIPGHGGILDRLDSIIFVLYAYVVYMAYL